MTFWATLYFTGKVVIALGFNELEDCNDMIATMETDTNAAYIEKPEVFADTIFPTNQFTYVCETERKPSHADYTQ